MWWGKAQLALGMLVLLACATGQADAVRCPAILLEHGQPHPLNGANVFDGPPEELADLIPVHGNWDLMPYKATGRLIYVVCHYRGTDLSDRWVVPSHVRKCRETKGVFVTVTCR
jgi:hypothetical protein